MSRHDSTGAGGIYIGLVPEEAQKWGVIGGRQKRSGKEVGVQLWSGKIATLSLLDFKKSRNHSRKSLWYMVRVQVVIYMWRGDPPRLLPAWQAKPKARQAYEAKL